MKFRYNVFNFSTAMVFVAAFFCLMLYYIAEFMFYPAMAFFAAGFGLLSAILIKFRKKYLADLEQKQEVLVMERTMNDDGETFVMRDQKQDKKERKKRRHQKFQQLLPIIFSIAASAFFTYLLISTLVVNLIK